MITVQFTCTRMMYSFKYHKQEVLTSFLWHQRVRVYFVKRVNLNKKVHYLSGIYMNQLSVAMATW